MRSLCAFVAVSAMAAPVPVSQPVYGPAPGSQFYAAAAANGDQYLVVWTDERAEVTQTYAARVARGGTVLDPNGFRVASDALAYYPQVIWGGSSWFVLANTCEAIELVRVARNGAVLDPEPRILPMANACPGMSVATDGHHVVVSYVTGFSAYEPHALIFNSDGEAIADIRLSAGEAEGIVPAIAWDGSSFVAVWGARAVRFNATGTLGPVRNVSIAGSASNQVRVASDGKNLLVVRGSLAFRMNADLDAEFLLTLPFSTVKSIAWTGSSYVIAGVVPIVENGRLHEGNMNLVRLDREGSLLAQREVRAQGIGARPANGAAVATNGQNVLVAWHDPTDHPETLYPDSDTYASIVSLPELTAGPRQLLSVSAGRQLRPSTAASGSNQLTVWQESTGLYARRHWRDGRTDPAPIRVTSTQTSSEAVVFNGTDFIVASTEGTAVVTRRLPADGELRVDRESRFDRGRWAGPVALASNGTVTLVAWLEGALYAARIGADGALIDEVPLVVAPSHFARTTHRIGIAPNRDGEFLVVWGGTTPACIYCSPTTLGEAGDLRAARVTSTLTLLDRPAIEVAILTEDPDTRADHSLHADHPSVTSNGSEWLVVWNRAFVETVAGEWVTREEIRGRRVARNGTLLDGSPEDPGVLIARNGFAPTVAWTGSGYLVGWYEGTPTHRWDHSRLLHRLHTATLDRLGGPLSNERTLGESPVPDPISIAVAGGVAGMAYSRLGDDARFGGVSRAFLDVLGPDSRRRAVRR